MAAGIARGSRSTRALLRVGDTPAASVHAHAGGEPYAEVVTEPGGLLPYAKKHLGPVRFADLEAQVAMDAHPALFRWVREAWFGSPGRDRVALEVGEAASVPGWTIELSQARIEEVVLPALDSASRERRSLSLRIAAGGVRRVARAGAVSFFAREERDFYANNFTVAIDGLDCSGVVAVEAISVRTEPAAGGRSARIVFPDLHLHVEEARAEPFRAWFEDFVLRGRNGDEQERDCTITYLDPLLSEPLAVLQIRHMGIYRVAAEPTAAAGSRRVRVDLYCERIEVTASDAPSGTTQEMPPLEL